jgi:hypothetical protein
MYTINESKINSSYMNTKRENVDSILDTSGVIEGNMLLGALNDKREELSSSSWLKSQATVHQPTKNEHSPIATPVKRADVRDVVVNVVEETPIAVKMTFEQMLE